MTKIEKVSGSKVKFLIEVQPADLAKNKKKVLAKWRANVDAKGFRKGNAPDAEVIKQVGDEKIAFETLNFAVTEQYQKFVMENKLQPLSPPDLAIKDAGADQKPALIEITVEVFPEISIDGYQNIKVKKPESVKVCDAEVEETIQTLLAQMGKGKNVSRAAKKGDLLRVDFEAKDKKTGHIIPKTNAKNTKFRVGMGHFLPDLESAFVGMKAGESKKAVPVAFPKDYPSTELAGQKVGFDLVLHEVSEISVDILDEKTIEETFGKKMTKDELIKMLGQNIQARKQQSANQVSIRDYEKALAAKIKVDLPASWIGREVENALANLSQKPEFKADPAAFWAQIGKTEDEFKAEQAKIADQNLKIFLALAEVVKLEKIELDDAEKSKAHELAHHHLPASAGHEGAAHESEVAKATLNLKIEKFLQQKLKSA